MNHLLSAGARLVSAAFLGVSLAAMGHAAAQSAPRPAPTGSRLALAGSDAEITISAVSEATIRIRIDSAQASARPAEDSVLVQSDWPGKKQRITSPQSAALFKFGKIHVAFTSRPLVVAVEGADGRVAQRLRFDEQTGNFTFLLGDGPVFGLGAGGPQFDRRGNA